MLKLVNFNRWDVSDARQHRAGHHGDGDGTGEVVVLTIPFILQVECLLDLALLRGQRHFPQEGVHEDIVVVDLRDGESGWKRRTWLVHTRRHTHTNLDLDWPVRLLPVEESLGVEDGVGRVLVDRRANLLSFTANDDVRIWCWTNTDVLPSFQKVIQ